MSEADGFYVTEGALKTDAASYVVREADNELYEALMGGELCYVLTPSQMGKSSLMCARLHGSLRAMSPSSASI